MNGRSLLLAAAVIAVAAVPACDDEDDAPTCDDLQAEANGCQATTQSAKDSFAQFGATCKSQARFTAECRSCLKGKICSVTEGCDSACGK